MVSGARDCTVPRLRLQGTHLSGQRDIARCGDLPRYPGAGVQTRLLRGVPVRVAPAPRPLELDAGIRTEAVVIPSEAG